MRRPPGCRCSDGSRCEKVSSAASHGRMASGNDAFEKLIEGGNSDDLTNYGMVVVGRNMLVEFRLAEIVGNIDACFQK